MKEALGRSAAAALVIAMAGFHPGLSAREESEGERRERRAVERADRFAARQGTRDLRDLYRRAADAREKERQRERRAPGRTALGTALAPAWVSLGPTFNPTFANPIGSAKPGQDDTGLITAVAPHPTEAGTLIVGAAGGGLWKSVDGGASWKAVAENFPAGGLSIGAVAYAPGNPSRVYAGSSCGDSSTTKLGRPEDALIKTGLGFLRSDDGGETWNRLPGVPADFFWVISVDPANADTLLIGGDRGIHRSTDGGTTWAAVLTRTDGERVFAPAISRSAQTPSTLYAGLFRNGVESGSVFKSTDGGATWAGKSAGLPGNPDTRGRVQVVVAPTDVNRVYALISTMSGKQVDMAVSTDGGDTWTALELLKRSPAVNILDKQGGFANVLGVDPRNADVVYAGGLDLWKTTDGGASFRKITDWSSPTPSSALPYLHADQHALVFGADQVLYCGNDGGIFRSTDGGGSWTGLNKGIVGWLVDEVCLNPDASVLMNGAQDNGTSVKKSGTEWGQIGGGDGFACLVHPSNPQILTISVNNQGISRSTDGGKTFDDSTGLTEAGGDNPQSTWRTLLVQHPTNATRIFTYSKKKIWVSDDNGGTWRQHSETMPVIDDIEDLSISADGTRMLLVDDKSNVCESTDEGKNWTRKGELPVKGASAIRPGRQDANTIYATSKTLETQKERVWVSTDGGATFTPLSKTSQENGLPDLPVYVFEQDPTNAQVLWAGAFTGLYRSGDGGQTWQRHGTGLPNVPVTDIVFPADGSKVIIGTAGRGLWETSPNPGAAQARPSAPTPPVAEFAYSPASPRPGQAVTFTDASQYMTSWSWDFGDGSAPSTKVNPSHVFAANGSYKVKLTVTSAAGSSVKEKTITVAPAGTGTGSALTYLVPVLVRAAGQGGTAFGTELTLTNRSGKDLSLTFTASTISGSATYTLKAGQEVHPDVFAFLTARGLDVPADGSVVTPLRIAVTGAGGLGEFGAQVRVTTPPNADLRAQGVAGKFGLAFPATPLTQGASREAYLYGLQQTSNAGQIGARTNVACVNAGAGSGGTIRLEITYRDGETGLAHAQKDTMELSPFQFSQLGTPLASRGLKNAFAQIKRVSGDDQFVCYATIVDNIIGDSAFVPMTVTDTKVESTEAMVPVILDVAGYKSEMTFANRTAVRVAGEFAVINSATSVPEFGEFEIEPLSQVIIPDVIAELRTAGFNLPPGTVASVYFQFETAPEGASGRGGSEVSPVDVSTSDVSVSVRTYTSRANGLLGLAYPANPVGLGADTDAYVFGLQQSGTRGQEGGTRSNLALVHALGGEYEELKLEVTYYDGSARELGKEDVTLQVGQWRQINTPLARYEGVTQGYARVRRVSGSDQFIAYGVLNDQANDDGSFVPMIIP